MKIVYIIIALFISALIGYSMMDPNPWMTDYELAKHESLQSGKPILLYFSGSDWCGICMKMKKDILETNEFISFASGNLVLVMADFPRMKKNRLDERTTKQNEALAAKYNPQGGFPFTLLLSPDGKIIKSWNGLPNTNSQEFVEQLKKCKKYL